MARLTFALPLGIIAVLLGLELLVRLISVRSRETVRTLVALSAPLLLCVAVQLWYNHARYGSIWKLELQRPGDKEMVAGVGGKFNLRRVPANLRNYLVPQRNHVTSTFPFFRNAPCVREPQDVFLPHCCARFRCSPVSR